MWGKGGWEPPPPYPPTASPGHGAGSSFNPQDRQGINSGHQGLSASRDLLSQWLQEDFGSCVCCSCPCTRASAGSLIFKRLLWQISSHLGRWQRLEGPGRPIRVRIPGGLPTPQFLLSKPSLCLTILLYLALGNNHVRLPRALAGSCRLWSLTLPVAELGLGYASEEKVIFRYCAGSCPQEAHTQHSLVLARLRGRGRAHGRPCCQPTSYADVTFLDDQHHWQQLPQLSAAACGCGG